MRWEEGLRLPRSSCSDLGNEGVSDPFPHRKREYRKKENPTHPKIALAKIPLAQRVMQEWDRRDLGLRLGLTHLGILLCADDMLVLARNAYEANEMFRGLQAALQAIGLAVNGEKLSGMGDSQRDSRESIRANHSQLKPLFL